MADSAGDAAEAARVGADPLVGVACPLLVAVGSGAVDPAEYADNRCAASDPPAPLSLIQQRLVCLEADHLDCPRYVRATGSARGGSGRLGRQASARGGSTVGVVAAAEPGRARRGWTAARSGDVLPSNEATGAGVAGAGVAVEDPDSETSPADTAPSAGSSASSAQGSAVAAGDPAVSSTPVVPVAPVVRSTRRSGARPARSRPGPIVVALGILVAALVIAFAFTSLRGGLTLPGVVPTAGSAGPSPIPSELMSPTPTVSPTPAPSPTSTPSPGLTPTPPETPQPSVPPAFVGMKACPDAPDCYLYRVHNGDTLSGIAQHFGVTKAAIRSLNPEITDPSLIHVGDMIRIPLPPPA